MLSPSNQVFLDVTDMIDYNVSILNVNDLSNAFFCLAKHDPTVGFPYDASRLTGHLYPETANESLGKLRGAWLVTLWHVHAARLTLVLLKLRGYPASSETYDCARPPVTNTSAVCGHSRGFMALTCSRNHVV